MRVTDDRIGRARAMFSIGGQKLSPFLAIFNESLVKLKMTAKGVGEG